MEIIHLNQENFDSTIAKASAIVKSAGVIIYPTDTCYGIGGLRIPLVEGKVSKIKGRGEGKKYSVIVDSIKKINQIAEVNPRQEKILQKNLPGKFTFILKSHESKETIGIRLPKHRFSVELAKAAGRSILSTSANLSGKQNPYSLDDLKEGILTSEQAELIELVIIAEMMQQTAPSTIVDLVPAKPMVIREGSGDFRN